LRGVCREQKDNVHNVGPYVHLKQFMEEVERRAEKRALDIANHMGGEYYCPEYYFSEKAQELARETEEGKV
jgi:hypothetical protein